MNKKGHNCNACDKTFITNQEQDEHMEDKHSEHCSFCDIMCDNEAEQNIECINSGVQSVSCQKCDNKFTNFAMRRHKEVCKGKQEFDCPESGVIGSGK